MPRYCSGQDSSLDIASFPDKHVRTVDMCHTFDILLLMKRRADV